MNDNSIVFTKIYSHFLNYLELNPILHEQKLNSPVKKKDNRITSIETTFSLLNTSQANMPK